VSKRRLPRRALAGAYYNAAKPDFDANVPIRARGELSYPK
jgi:hypothetical protein